MNLTICLSNKKSPSSISQPKSLLMFSNCINIVKISKFYNEFVLFINAYRYITIVVDDLEMVMSLNVDMEIKWFICYYHQEKDIKATECSHCHFNFITFLFILNAWYVFFNNFFFNCKDMVKKTFHKVTLLKQCKQMIIP